MSSRPPRSSRGPSGGSRRPPRPAAPRPPERQRRALSTVRSGGRIERGGDRELAELAAEALRAPAREREVADSLTHPFHTYPARMDPASAKVLVEGLAGGGGGRRATVLDPFCGSGTTLVEARAAGLAAIGSDLNPLAVAIARAKTWTAPAGRRAALRALGGDLARRVLAEGKAARRSGHQAAPLRRVGPRPEARDRALGEWFAPHVRRELEQLGGMVDEARARDAELGAILQVVLSSILYKVSRRASDTDPTRVERQVGRGAAARLFANRVELLCAGLDDLARVPGPMPRLLVADARGLGREVADRSVDVVVTSPPYAGTYDYADLHRLRMIFLGMDVAPLERREIGARSRFVGTPDRTRKALGGHVGDMAGVLKEMGRVLVPGGLSAVVVGDSLAGREAVRADAMVRDALAAVPARAGLRVVAWAWQERPAVSGAERRAFSPAAPKREHVVLIARG